MNKRHTDQSPQARARAWFELQGISITDWAAARNYDRALVYALLSGRSRGRRGKGHEIAVALGLKPRAESVVQEFPDVEAFVRASARFEHASESEEVTT